MVDRQKFTGEQRLVGDAILDLGLSFQYIFCVFFIFHVFSYFLNLGLYFEAFFCAESQIIQKFHQHVSQRFAFVFIIIRPH